MYENKNNDGQCLFDYGMEDGGIAVPPVKGYNEQHQMHLKLSKIMKRNFWFNLALLMTRAF